MNIRQRSGYRIGISVLSARLSFPICARDGLRRGRMLTLAILILLFRSGALQPDLKVTQGNLLLHGHET